MRMQYIYTSTRIMHPLDVGAIRTYSATIRPLDVGAICSYAETMHPLDVVAAHHTRTTGTMGITGTCAYHL
jgi:hypothetical protein